ncbi:SRPBCC family protein [Luteipulveratus mongoliensis]|uniref:Polyketide cyclase n=1 Tax=Luteipulveratus mongoliensis TaxID=571913 RepID=A0A0K1JPD4_9MICO|nr:SRPBCC family protein [Luteipulveratus mongoliensis]AKU18448.1 hypothetical protein VV02_25655 [Luteipulveratus mongoliensis]
MTDATFQFASVSHLDAAPDRVFDALREPEHWDRWWPQIRHIQPYDDESGLVVIRSLLPVTLRVVVTRQVVDPDGGVLRAGLTGDLTGWSQFVVRREGRGTHLDYTQECAVTKRRLGRAAQALRPVLLVNHAAMMRAGMRGLQSYASSSGTT